jgi:hypothetical protein
MLETVAIIVVVFGAVIFVVAAWREDTAEQAEFEGRFPPITDEEFVARCEPGCDPVVAIKVRRIVSEQLNVEYARIHPSSRFIEDLKAD